jgi:hypothetical protein
MNDLKLGLVLSGGGAKGAYQLGVWKAMEEFDLSRRVRAVSGSSVGALNDNHESDESMIITNDRQGCPSSHYPLTVNQKQ